MNQPPKDALMCDECLLRIWRPMDGGPMIDSFIGSRHLNCNKSVEFQKEMARENEKKGFS